MKYLAITLYIWLLAGFIAGIKDIFITGEYKSVTQSKRAYLCMAMIAGGLYLLLDLLDTVCGLYRLCRRR